MSALRISVQASVLLFCAILLVLSAPLLAGAQEQSEEKTPEAKPIAPYHLSATPDACVACHSKMPGPLGEVVAKWETSVHKDVEVGCADCHMTNPKDTSTFLGAPSPLQVPEFCARCHADAERMRPYNIRIDQFIQYRSSVHGKALLERGDTNVATCESCHGSHGILRKDNPQSSVFHANVPETCGTCHANQELMAQYSLPATILADYKAGYHGQILYEKVAGKNPALAPNCADCHGTHGATPPGITVLASVCSNCHKPIFDAFKESIHSFNVLSGQPLTCATCHGNHKNVFPTPALFQSSERGGCESCHEKDSKGDKVAHEIGTLIQNAQVTLKEIQDNIAALRRAGRNVDDLASAYNSARTNYIEMGTITHSLDLTRIQTFDSEVSTQIEKIRKLTDALNAAVAHRKYFFFYSLLIIAIICGLLIARYSTLKR